MISTKQTEADRRNALMSTGPKTPEGKAVAALNSLKHGLLSREVLLSGEEEAALDELRERLRAELQPVGELESFLRLARSNSGRVGGAAPSLSDQSYCRKDWGSLFFNSGLRLIEQQILWGGKSRSVVFL